MKLTKEQLLGIVRHTVTFVGGILIAKGYIDNSILAEVVGAATALAGAVWSIISKKQD